MNWNPIKYFLSKYQTDSDGYLSRKGFDALLPEEKAKICNGMGSTSTWWNRLLKRFIPQSFIGLDMADIGDRHDYGYYLGGPWWQKIVTDLVFLYNMLIRISKGNKKLRKARIVMALQYYLAVALGGKAAFNYRGKE